MWFLQALLLTVLGIEVKILFAFFKAKRLQRKARPLGNTQNKNLSSTHHFGNIFTNDIKLEIYFIAYLYLL